MGNLQSQMSRLRCDLPKDRHKYLMALQPLEIPGICLTARLTFSWEIWLFFSHRSGIIGVLTLVFLQVSGTETDEDKYRRSFDESMQCFYCWCREIPYISRNATFKTKRGGVSTEGRVSQKLVYFIRSWADTLTADEPRHIRKIRWHRIELNVFIKVRRDFYLPKKNVLTKK